MNSKHQNLRPFSCSYSPNAPEILSQLNCTIAISTYQAGKVIFIGAINDEKIIQLPRNFKKAMGIALDDDKMAVACKDEIILFRNSEELAKHYPKKPNIYDAMYMPRVTYHTGALDVHDIDFCKDGLCAVNTNFSCIIKVDENYSFTPIWKPKFIKRVVSGDHCHLNGMAVEDKEIKYVSAFANTDSPQAWKTLAADSGVMIDYQTKEIIATKLSMPHSPRIYDGKLYLLLSATGEFVELNPTDGTYRTLLKIDGFVRGLAFHEGIAFIGLSKIRKNSSSFGKLDIAAKANKAGIVMVHLQTATIIANIFYESSVEEIYDVQILAGKRRPSILNKIKEDYKLGITTPDTTFWGRIIEDEK